MDGVPPASYHDADAKHARSEPETKPWNIHDEFRHILMLLVLVKTITNGFPRLGVSGYAKGSGSRRVTMDAVTTILSRAHEVVAATTCDSEPAHITASVERDASTNCQVTECPIVASASQAVDWKSLGGTQAP